MVRSESCAKKSHPNRTTRGKRRRAGDFGTRIERRNVAKTSSAPTVSCPNRPSRVKWLAARRFRTPSVIWTDKTMMCVCFRWRVGRTSFVPISGTLIVKFRPKIRSNTCIKMTASRQASWKKKTEEEMPNESCWDTKMYMNWTTAIDRNVVTSTSCKSDFNKNPGLSWPSKILVCLESNAAAVLDRNPIRSVCSMHSKLSTIVSRRRREKKKGHINVQQ